MDIAERIVPDAAKEFVIDSNEALLFKLVRSPSDMENEDGFFNPEMSHQVYGSNEEIFGYRDLEISLYVSAARLNFYCQTSYESIVSKSVADFPPDKLVEPIAELLPPGVLLDNKERFMSLIDEEKTFRPMGDQIDRWNYTSDDGSVRNFEIYECSQDTPDFAEYFERLQMFVMFYVDAASMLDLDDNKWKFFVAYETFTGVEGGQQFAVCGYGVVYEFYAYPEHIRPRISQMLVLPPFQRLGVGSSLLRAIYTKYTTNPLVTNITVEDPSDLFANMKLKLDCENCMKLPLFSPKHLRNGITKKQYDLALSKLKLGKSVVLKVFNVLRLRCSSEDQHYKTFEADIKKQLSLPLRKQDKTREKVRKLGVSEEEINEVCNVLPVEKRPEVIHEQFLDLRAKLSEIVDRLPTYDSAEELR